MKYRIQNTKKKVAMTMVVLLATILATTLATGGVMGAAKLPSIQPETNPQAVVTIDLWARTGNVGMPDGASIPIWGFTNSPTDPGMLPGPVINVNEGDVVTVVLTNADVPENVSIIFPGQNIAPDFVGVPMGSSATYAFTATNPGTFLYESGVNPQKQVQMGLYGALIVRPTTSGQAYNDVDGRSAYDVEAILVFSEIDPAIHDGTATSLLDFDPKYFLINGKAFPDTEEIVASPSQRVLIRYLNAGFINHTPLLLGLHQEVIAHDGFLLNFSYATFSQIVASGETYDLITEIPADGAPDSKYPLYERGRAMHTYSGDTFPGGMLTFIALP